jgi:hypothetical protein
LQSNDQQPPSRKHKSATNDQPPSNDRQPSNDSKDQQQEPSINHKLESNNRSTTSVHHKLATKDQHPSNNRPTINIRPMTNDRPTILTISSRPLIINRSPMINNLRQSIKKRRPTINHRPTIDSNNQQQQPSINHKSESNNPTRTSVPPKLATNDQQPSNDSNNQQQEPSTDHKLVTNDQPQQPFIDHKLATNDHPPHHDSNDQQDQSMRKDYSPWHSNNKEVRIHQARILAQSPLVSLSIARYRSRLIKLAALPAPQSPKLEARFRQGRRKFTKCAFTLALACNKPTRRMMCAASCDRHHSEVMVKCTKW